MNQDSIRFTIRGSISTYMLRMKEVRSRITVILELAQTDFLAVNDIFRKCHADADLHPAMASRISDSIKFLQYMDTLTQKMNHIVTLNQALMEAEPLPLVGGTPDDDPVEFIFRLNYFQALVAHNEFLSTIDTVKQLISELNREYNLEKIICSSGRKAFHNLELEESNMNLLLLALHSIYTERRDEHRNSICQTSDVSTVTRVYTMNSERMVLDWLQTHPHDHASELLRIYSHTGFGQVEEQTEIF